VLVPDRWGKITLGLIRRMVEIRIGSASPDAYGLNVGTVDVPEKKWGSLRRKGELMAEHQQCPIQLSHSKLFLLL